MKKRTISEKKYFHLLLPTFSILILCIIVLILSTKGITEESVVSMQGDMPKYLMNGAFFYDFFHDLPLAHPLEYAYRYFVKYPALSLGHHPIFPGFATAPFYALFGMSVFSARLSTVFFMLIAAISWFLLIRSIYDELIAFLSSLLFITAPFIVIFSRVVMSEISTLALIILTTYLFVCYCDSERNGYILTAAISLSLSVYSKHTAVFMLPVFLIHLLMKKGWKGLIKREVLIACLIFVLLVAPLVPITLKFSHSTLNSFERTTLKLSSSSAKSFGQLTYFLRQLWQEHLTLPVLILSLCGMLVASIRRDKHAVLFLAWILCCYGLMTFLGYKKPRYAMYWIPPFCFFATVPLTFFASRSWKILVMLILSGIAVYQLVASLGTNIEYAKGYEKAAQYVVEHKKGDSVLFSGIKDTSYFVFFMRKHNPAQDMIVLRSDKILATSRMSRIVRDRIQSREEIYTILQRYGVAYIVVEDIPSHSQALDWLREELQTERFILREDLILSITSRDELKLHALRNHSIEDIPLRIYEYKHYTPAQKDAMVDMEIPLIGDSIRMSFGEILR